MKAKVLIVDDRVENLVALEKVLSKTNAEVLKAGSGNEALKLLMKNQFALAILDVQMPSMDGYELAELMREEVKQASLPIIFVSAVYSDNWHIFKGYESGAVDFLAKPFNPAQLIAKVDVFLNLYQQREYYRQKIDHLGLAYKEERDSAKHYQLTSKRHKNASILTAELANMIQHNGSSADMMLSCLRVVVELMNTDSGMLIDYNSKVKAFSKLATLGQVNFSEQGIVEKPEQRYFSLVNSATQPDLLQQVFVNMSGNPYVLVIYDPIENLGLLLGNQRENPIDKFPFEQEDRIVIESAINIITLLIDQRKSRGSSIMTSQLFERLTSDHRQNIQEILATQASFGQDWNEKPHRQSPVKTCDQKDNIDINLERSHHLSPNLSQFSQSAEEVKMSDHSLRFEAEKTGVFNTLSKALVLEQERGQVIDKLAFTNRILDATRSITQLVTRERRMQLLLQQSCERLVSSGVFLSSSIRIVDPQVNQGMPQGFFAGDKQYSIAEGVIQNCIAMLGITDQKKAIVSQLNCEHANHDSEPPIFISAVIVHQSKIYGLLLGSVSPKETFDEKVRVLLGEIAQELGFAIHSNKREQLLKHQDLELKLILDATDIGTWTYSVNRERGQRSPHIAKFTGAQANHLKYTRKMWEGAIHPDDLSKVLMKVNQHLQGKSESYEVEYRIQHADRSWFWVRDRGRVVEQNSKGEPLILCGTQSNISAQKQAEHDQNVLQEQLSQSQKLEPIGRLAGGVAHDFNNLLSVIMGYSDLLLMDQDHSQKTTRKLNTIKQACEKAKDLTTQLLMFSRKQTIQPKVVNWNTLIQESLSVYSRLIEESIEVKLDIGESIPLISADPQQLDQIIANLLVNARDAIQQVNNLDHKPVISISMTRTGFSQPSLECQFSQDYVCLRVEDNGIGMDEEVKERIFEPFYSTKSSSKGTGLGLATVFGIVEQNKGFIEVESDIGRGTSFAIYWPATEQLPQPTEQNVTDNLYGLGERIFVVEDELKIRQYFKEVLERFNYHVTLASSAEEMMELILAGNKPDLLITDVVLPGKSGHQLAQEVKQLWADLPILYSSGYTDDVISQHGVIDPEVNLLNKPFASEKLLTLIRQLLPK